MTTELKRFTDAYASMTVAVYEPLIVRWVSGTRLWTLADAAAKGALTKGSKHARGQVASNIPTRSAKLPTDPTVLLEKAGISSEHLAEVADVHLLLDAIKDREGLAYLEALSSADSLNVVLRSSLKPPLNGVEPAIVPVSVGNGSYDVRLGFDVKTVRESIRNDLSTRIADLGRAGALNKLPASGLRDMLLDVVGKHLAAVGATPGPDFLAVEGDIFEMLSPIGIAHFYRQLYFNKGEGVGPIEQAFTIAPAETLEVVYESVRRQTHEEFVEIGSESVSETAVEERNLSEVSDKVSSMIQRDSSAAMSANVTGTVSGGVGVWSASATAGFSASANLATSSQRSNEVVNRNLKETTRRAAERITKSVKLSTRDVLDVTTTNVTRRVISNTTMAPLSYGLRRVFNRVNVKVQSLGPRLVWQLYVRNPGDGLARSRFVHFMDSTSVADPVAPPATKPRPEGGADTGTTSAALQWEPIRKTYFVTVVVRVGSDRKVTAVSIDGITDLEGGGKEDYNPAPRNDVQWGGMWDSATNTFTVNIGIIEGDAASVQISYSYVYEPGPTVIAAWEAERAAAQAAFAAATAEARAKALREQFERDKELITERSKIRPRPANDLRREERFEVLNRMVSHLFARSQNAPEPSPLDIELFHRYFDIEAMFLYAHPSWWKPRYSPIRTGLRRAHYEITPDSDPAPMGSSLAWALQLDGDTRRNEFLNSPWVRVCLPLRPGREREAIAWLSKHVEGELGYDPGAEPLKGLLHDIEAVRTRETSLGINGPEYVTVSSTMGAPGVALTPENVYPVVNEFDVTLPSDGFVYDELVVKIP